LTATQEEREVAPDVEVVVEVDKTVPQDVPAASAS
jgi:hypothetical protein